VKKAETTAEPEAVAEGFRKLKMHYDRAVIYLIFSDGIEQQRKNSNTASKAMSTA